MPFTVALTRRAEIDVVTAEAWVSQLGQVAVARWRKRMVNAVAELERDAVRYPEADESADLPFDLKETIFGRWPHIYRILFTIDGNSVMVLRVRHAARDRISDTDL